MPIFTLVTQNKLDSYYTNHPLIYRVVNSDYPWQNITPLDLPTILLIEDNVVGKIDAFANYAIIPGQTYYMPSQFLGFKSENINVPESFDSVLYQILDSLINFEIKTKITIEDLELLKLSNKKVVIDDGRILEISFAKSLYYLDLEILSFLQNKTREEVKFEILSSIGEHYFYNDEPSFNNIQLLQRAFGLIDIKHSLPVCQNYYEHLKINYDDKYRFEIRKRNFYNHFFYQRLLSSGHFFNPSFKKGLEQKLEADFLLFETQKYFSNVDLYNNIDTSKYSDLNFPINKKKLVYEYQSVYTLTGRIYTKTDGKFTALQTLPKQKRDAVIAEPNCNLIEFDFSNFEFDILLQKVGFNFDKIKDIDFHLEVIQDTVPPVISEKFLKFYNLNDFRAIGKQVNYSITYGMVLDKAVEILKDTLEQKFLEKGIKKDLSQYLEFFRTKLLKNKYLSKILEFRDDFPQTKQLFYDFTNKTSQSNLIYNHFKRIVKVEKSHALLNNYVQSTAADFINFKIKAINNLFIKNKLNSKNKILLQNHDSILLQLTFEVLSNSNVFEQIIKILESSEGDLFGRVKFGFGDNWKELS